MEMMELHQAGNLFVLKFDLILLNFLNKLQKNNLLFVSPVILILVELISFGNPETDGETNILYPDIVAPPLLVGTPQLNCTEPFPALAFIDEGGPGKPTVEIFADTELLRPLEFSALTSTLYVLPF